MKRTAIVLALLAVAVTLPTAAFAQGYRWLNESAVSRFTKEDWAMLRANARKALDDAANGETRSWSNPATGNSGSVTPMSSYEKDGRRCRRARFVSESKDRSGTQIHNMCKYEDGSWKIAP